MTIKLPQLGGLFLSIISVGITTTARVHAQTAASTSLPEALNQATSSHSGDYLGNRTLGRQLTRILGVGFPEQEMELDAGTLAALVKELVYLQNSRDPILRVGDLPTPYTTSLLTLPRPQSSIGTEFIFENR
ncbi:MAG: hypothetical protein KGQ93_04175 [Cyanobacteria bacterium REEB459]|nr:hypothetical protein [Cyanobacteria bacterium REEB459]